MFYGMFFNIKEINEKLSGSAHIPEKRIFEESCGYPQFFYLNKHIMQRQRGKDFSEK